MKLTDQQRAELIRELAGRTLDPGIVIGKADAEALADELAPLIEDWLSEPAEQLRDLIDRLGYGNGITEPQADNGTIAEEVEDLRMVASEHADCPVWCDECTDWEMPRTCQHCDGSGCGPGTATGAYDECAFCAGDGRHHQGDHPHLPYEWTEREEWRVRVGDDDWATPKIPKSVAELIEGSPRVHLRRRTVWESEWEDA